MNLEPDFSDFLAALIKNKVDFVIIGAFALAHHGAPRATGDFDVWVRRPFHSALGHLDLNTLPMHNTST